MSALEKFPILRLAKPEDMDELRDAAAKDGHAVTMPTHVVEKNGKIVGFVSLGAIPMVLTWQSTKDVSARDSLSLLSTVETILKMQGVQVWCMPCVENSPYRPFMEKFGYTNYGSVALFFKDK